MKSNIQIIGISGKSGTGKDYLFNRFLKPDGWYQFSFAWPLKARVVAITTATHDEVFKTKPPHVGQLLQDIGEGERQELHPRIWIDSTFEWMQILNENYGIDKFVVPDVRYINEAEALKERGAAVYRIEAPNRAAANRLTPKQRLHISETELDHWDGFDGFIYNDYNHSETLHRQMQLLFDIPAEADDPEEGFWVHVKNFLLLK